MNKLRPNRMGWALILLLCLTLSVSGCFRRAPQKAEADKEADVVVLGGGGAGLAAATAAAEKGASVILIEKAAFLGGNTVLAGGAFNAVNPELQGKEELKQALRDELEEILEAAEGEFGDFKGTLATLKEQIQEYFASGETKLFDSVELHMIHTYLGGKRTDLAGNEIASDFALTKTLCTNAPKAKKWLEEHGVEFSDKIDTVLGALWPRTNSVIGMGNAYIKALSEAARAKDVEIMLETRGKELIMEEGKVVGVKAEDAAGKEITIRAKKGLVMATGGFGANPEMRAKYNTYWEDLPLEMPTTNSPHISGDGIVMGEKVGANLVGMGFIQLMPSSHPETGSLFSGVWGSAETQLFVNKDGRRFVNEYAERDVLSKAALQQEDALFFIIVDQQIVGDRDIEVMLERKDIFQADTLEELAEMIAVPPENLVAEVEKYNGYVDNQHDPDFGKENFGNRIEEPPFVATPRSPAVHHTMGGLQIDTEARVLAKDGKPIPGLYAAGEVTGGIHAGNRLGGNAQADIFVFGRTAGENAAEGK
ncbi:MAG: flavocytochrome c [Firmicutes bacterium]|nr:flavocytochrome c [Bacillota bacterium]